jgi:hypothetical protein
VRTAISGSGTVSGENHQTFGLSNCIFKCEVNENEISPADI